MLTEGMSDQELIADLTAKIEQLKEELDTERMRLAACGVIALSNTPDSAKQARQMKYEYWSASCADVADAVDREMALRDKLAECQAREAKLRKVLNSIWMNCALRVDGIKQATKEAIALPHDDTALREYRRKVLLEAVERLNHIMAGAGIWRDEVEDELRRMAEEA